MDDKIEIIDGQKVYEIDCLDGFKMLADEAGK